MIFPRQKIYKFDLILLFKSFVNLDFFKHSFFLKQKLEKKILRFTKFNFCTVTPRGRVGLKLILNIIKKKNQKKKKF